MARLAPLELTDLDPELRKIMAAGEQVMGFIPSDALTMAYFPELLKAMLGLVEAIYSHGKLDRELKRLIGLMTSSAAGCQYCQGHTFYSAIKQGINQDKLAAIWDYPKSEFFSEAERAALRVAHLAALTPNQVEDEHIDALKKHYSASEVAEIVGVIAMFGFLNRWNDTLKTDLEAEPRSLLPD